MAVILTGVQARRWMKLEQQSDYGLDYKRFSAIAKAPGYQYPFLHGPVNY